MKVNISIADRAAIIEAENVLLKKFFKGDGNMDMSFGIVPPSNSNNCVGSGPDGNNRATKEAIMSVARKCEKTADMVAHPNHYNSKSMECKDVISVMVEGLEGDDAFFMGNAIKYLYRFGDKGTPEQDLRKAKQYIDFMLEKY